MTSVESSSPPLLQVGEQAVDRHVGRQAVAGVVAGQVGVGVPLAVAVDLDEPHAALDQSAGQQALRPDTTCVSFAIEPVHLPRRLPIPATRSIRRRASGLHPVGQLERLDAAQTVPASPGWASQVLGVESARAGRAAGAGRRASRRSGRLRFRIGFPSGRKSVPW